MTLAARPHRPKTQVLPISACTPSSFEGGSLWQGACWSTASHQDGNIKLIEHSFLQTPSTFGLLPCWLCTLTWLPYNLSTFQICCCLYSWSYADCAACSIADASSFSVLHGLGSCLAHFLMPQPRHASLLCDYLRRDCRWLAALLLFTRWWQPAPVQSRHGSAMHCTDACLIVSYRSASAMHLLLDG